MNASETVPGCPCCGSTDMESGEFDATHPDDELPEGDYRNRRCEDCGEAFDLCATVSVEVA